MGSGFANPSFASQMSRRDQRSWVRLHQYWWGRTHGGNEALWFFQAMKGQIIP